jgi:hypothetical protein
MAWASLLLLGSSEDEGVSADDRLAHGLDDIEGAFFRLIRCVMH